MSVFKQSYIPYGEGHLKTLRKHLPERFNERVTNEIWDFLASEGFLNIPKISEVASSNINGSKLSDKTGEDWENGREQKLATVFFDISNKVYYAQISGLSAKTGIVQAQIYNPFNEMSFWFKIPKEAYHPPGEKNRDSIKIYFNKDFSPKRVNRQPVNFWNYEVNSFEEMASY